MKAEERAVDAIGWFTKTVPDSEDQQLLDDVAEAIRQAEAAARAEERAECAKIADRNGNAITASQIRARD